MKKTDKIIGIDLGTTNSCVSVMEGKNYKVIDNAEGNATTPSIIAIREKEVLVGQAAKQQAITNSENTFFAIKRLIGRRYNDPQIKEIRKYVPYNIVEAKNGDAWVVDKVTGKQYPPSQISSMILSKMKKTAEEYLGAEVHRAVITVPAYFNNEQRKATIEAGKIAKLKVERIINEPTAAALAYGLDREKNKKIVVYDLGGGTFDVSILELSDDVFEVLSTTGNTYLGGEDFDLRILNYLADAFQKEHNIDLRKDKMALQRLKEAAEKAKIELSTAVETEINLPFITANQDGPKHLNMKITRAKLEHLVEDLIKKTVAPCLNALKDAGLKVSDIDDVIPVGGMTRMPKVQEQIRSLFKKEPHKGVNPDEVVAIGAAIQGAIISGDVKDLLLLDACSLSLGIETVGGKFTVLIKRNTTLPTVKSQIFSTAQDNQESVAVKVYQGERPIAADNNLLGIFQLHGIRPAPRGLPQIQVTFDVNHDGTISVSAEDLGTKQKQSINVAAQQGLNQDEIDKMIKASEANAEEDATRIRIIDTKNEVDHLIYSTNKLLDQYKDKIDKDVKEDIQKDIDELKKLMNKSDIKLPELQEGLEKLKQSSIKLSDVIKQHAATNQQDSAQSAQPEDAHSESDQGHQDYQSGSESHQSTENNRQGKDSKPEDVIDVEFEENKK